MNRSESQTPSAEDLRLEFYRRMFLIRALETRLLALFSQGLVRGTLHTCIGQEACAVGVMRALDRDLDLVFSNHRAHGHFLAYSEDLEGLVAEILGRVGGLCGGIGGSQHLYKSNFYTNGVQGGMVPSAVGAAWAEKIKGTAAVTVCFLGDGTMGQGIVYECLNLAALWRAPLIFALEDNQYAQSTPKRLAHAGDLARRAEPFGIPVVAVDGNDPFAVCQAVREAHARIRGGEGPQFLHLQTYRLGPHSKGDDTRSPEEIERHRRVDPLLRLGASLSTAERRAVEEEASLRIESAVERALALPLSPAGARP